MVIGMTLPTKSYQISIKSQFISEALRTLRNFERIQRRIKLEGFKVQKVVCSSNHPYDLKNAERSQ